jgi:hypothetical protein
MALTKEEHLNTIKRVQTSLAAHIVDLQHVADEISDDDEVDDDIKEGLNETVTGLEEIKDDLGGFTGETTAE